MLPFTVLDSARAPVGMTTYMNIDAANRRVEIGSIWYAKRVQRTPLNTECKLMLLRHAFEALDCIAVEFRTHRFNDASRRAIERLGAQLDGILRAHQRLPDGSLRDTAGVQHRRRGMAGGEKPPAMAAATPSMKTLVKWPC